MDPLTMSLIVGGASALLQGLSTKIGTSKAAKRNKQTERLIQGNLARAEAERKAQPQNYLDTISGKAIMNRAGEQLQDNISAINNNAIKTGATNEQRLANSGAVQKAYNNIVQGIASQSDRYNQRNDAILQQARDAYTKGQVGINNAAAQSYVNAGVNTANAIGNVANGVMGMYALKSPTPTATTPTKSTASYTVLPYANTPTITTPTIDPNIMGKKRKQSLFGNNYNFASGTQGIMSYLRNKKNFV